MVRELSEEEVFGPEAQGASVAQLFVRDFDQVLDEIQKTWVDAIGLAEVPPVVMMSHPKSPEGVRLFAWPSPWLQ